ncbi:MAG: hypothetical protein LC790_15225 [Actinobacteria bacterium]|nr:hypothetical protein [Actinomycetota bacterium]
MVVVDRPQDRPCLLLGGCPGAGRHRLPRPRAQLIVGDAVVQQQPDEQVEQRDLLVGGRCGARLQFLELAQRLAVRFADCLIGAIEDLVDEPDGLLCPEAQQGGVAQAIGPTGKRCRRRAPGERRELAAAVRRDRVEIPAGRAELAQERELLQLRDDLHRRRGRRLAPQPNQAADPERDVRHAQRIQRTAGRVVEQRRQALVRFALGASAGRGDEPLERRYAWA